MQIHPLVVCALATSLAAVTPVHARAPQGERAEQRSPTELEEVAINVAAELMITDLGVVEDPLRTDPSNGDFAPWSFRYLVEQMAGDSNPSEFVLNWLELWAEDYSINGHHVAARAAIHEKVIEPWMQASGGQQLDLDIAPFKLLAIVNRMDVRNHTADGHVASAGEGRFVFGLLDSSGLPLAPLAGTAAGGFTMIFEYELAAGSMDDLRSWTEAWHGLGDYEPGSDSYNQALEAITRRFSERDDALGRPNGSPLNQIRTNEIALDSSWEMREFVIDYASGQLRPHTAALSPDPLSLNGTPMLARLINANEASLIRGDFDLKANWFAGASLSGPFTPAHFPDWHSRSFVTHELVEGLFYDVPWSASDINNNEARHRFAINTCNGCHRDETGTDFLQVGFADEHTLPGNMGVAAALSGYLTGTQVNDPVDDTTVRDFAQLQVRAADFAELVDSFDRSKGGEGPRREHRPRFVH